MMDTVPSRQVFAELPARLVMFLGACGKYPAIRAQVAAAGDTQAILGIELLLGRMDALESSPDRAATRDEDRAALTTLAQRGYTPAERQRLAGLVEIARRGTKQTEPISVAVAPSTVELEVYRFFNDWAETARVRIKRRDQLIMLGLAKRRRVKEDDAPIDDAKAPGDA